MRPANQQQAIRHMEHLLNRKIKGNRQTRVKEHLNRARCIATAIWARFQVGPYQYKLKHLRWYMEVCTRNLAPNTCYRYWLTIKKIVHALDKNAGWNILLESVRWGF